jgi:rhodanese-related sulfurtransferase
MAGIATGDWAQLFAVKGLNRFHGGPLDGYFPPTGNRRIAEILAETPTLRVINDEVVEGVPCKVVKARTPHHGEYTMWLDQDRGCLPRRVVYTLGPDDRHEYWDRIPFSELTVPGPDGKQHGGTEESGVLEGITYQRIADAFIAVSGRFTRVESHGEARAASVYSYTRSDIQLKPHFDGTDAFAPDLAEGARITNTMERRSGVKHEWRGGKVVIAGTDKGGDVPTYDAEPESIAVQFGMSLCGALFVTAGVFMTVRPWGKQGRLPPAGSVASRILALLLAVTIGSGIASAESAAKAPSRQVDARFEPYCGVQSLYRAMRSLGKDVTFAQFVTPEYISSTHGSSIADLQRAAEDHGVHLLPLTRMTCPMLRALKRPVILHVKSTLGANEYKHWVLFMGCNHGIARIYDGAKPGTEMTEDELAARWDGTGLVVSNEPVSELSVWLTFASPFLFYGGLCALCFGGLSVLGRYIDNSLRNVRYGALASTAAQAACLLVAAGGFCMGYRFVSETAYLSNERALAAIEDSHIGAFLPKVRLEQMVELMDTPGVTVVDARRSGDYQRGHLPGAISVPVDSTAAMCQRALADVPKDSRVVVYAQSKYCTYAFTVAKQLMALGYQNIQIFRDGYAEWQKRQASLASVGH